ncbi:MAG: hypothetical protein OEV78_07270 [Spirochaetia bacterium]|nr:hypothetical protein [Spirochaetia bacterium]
MVQTSINFLIGCLFFFIPIQGLLYSVEANLRLDNRFQVQWGDNATDTDISQSQLLLIQFDPSFSLKYSGILKKDLDGTTSKILPGFIDSTDVAFRDYNDAINPKQTWNYFIYEAFVEYKNPYFTVDAGRQYSFDFNTITFDGLLMNYKPFDWTRLTLFAGIPWHANDYNYEPLKEQTSGAGLHLENYEQNLMGDLRYMFLRENLPVAITAVHDTTVMTYKNIESHYLQANVGYEAAKWLKTYVFFSSLPSPKFLPMMMDVNVYGHFENILLDYKAGYSNQFISISDLTDKLTSYSMLLNSSAPYQNINLFLYKSIYDLLQNSKIFEDIQLELGGEKRSITKHTDINQYNPEYLMGQIGFILAMRGKLFFHVYYDAYKTTGLENTTNALGGDITKKWKTFTMSLGTEFNKYQYQTYYSGTLISDRFDSRDVFIRMNWLLNKHVMLKLDGAYSWARLASLSDYLLDSSASTPLISRSREYYKLDFNASLLF